MSRTRGSRELEIKQAVATHLRELPNDGLEALMDMLVTGGPGDLAYAITKELASRHPSQFRS